jgi:outer membrane protein
MKITFSSILFIILILSNQAFSEQKIAFIDMDRIVSTTQSGSSILKQLTDLNNKNLDFLKKEEKKFKEKEIKLISQKNIISETDFKNKVDELKSEIKNYKQKRNKILTDFNKLKLDNTNSFLKLINSILVKFSNDKKISIILKKNNLVVAKTELDITDEVIKIVNAEVKEFKIK